jgi:integrase
LAEMLDKHLADAPKSDFVFVRPDGTWLRRTTFRRAEWKPAVVAAGLDPALRFHDLRHTCAGLLKTGGIALDASFDMQRDRGAIRDLASPPATRAA